MRSRGEKEGALFFLEQNVDTGSSGPLSFTRICFMPSDALQYDNHIKARN